MTYAHHLTHGPTVRRDTAPCQTRRASGPLARGGILWAAVALAVLAVEVPLDAGGLARLSWVHLAGGALMVLQATLLVLGLRRLDGDR
jgi:hypothetical protein